MGKEATMAFHVFLTHMKRGPLGLHEKETSEHLFSSEETMEDWLVTNGFVYGQCRFHVPKAEPYWFHQQDIEDDYVEVRITEREVDITEKKIDGDWYEKWMDDLSFSREPIEENDSQS